MAVHGTYRDDVTPVNRSKEVSARQVATVLNSFAEPVWVGVCVHVLSCLLQMSVVSLTQRYAHAAAVVDTIFTCNSPHLPLSDIQPVMAQASQISTRYQCEAHSHSCIHMRILYHSQFEPQRVAPQSLHKVHSNTDKLEFSTFGASTRHSKCMSGDT